MEVPLDGTHGAPQGLGQGLHLGPAQPTLVVSVVSEGTICRDRLGGDTGEDEGLDLGDTRKLGVLRHQPPPIFGAAVRFDDRIHQSGGSSAKRIQPRRFFYALFYWCVLYLHGHPRASPRTTIPTTTQGVLTK